MKEKKSWMREMQLDCDRLNCSFYKACKHTCHKLLSNFIMQYGKFVGYLIGLNPVSPFQSSVTFHMKTSPLISSAYRLVFMWNGTLARDKLVDPLSANPTKWSNTLSLSAVAEKLFWVYLIILWGWRLKD